MEALARLFYVQPRSASDPGLSVDRVYLSAAVVGASSGLCWLVSARRLAIAAMDCERAMAIAVTVPVVVAAAAASQFTCNAVFDRVGSSIINYGIIGAGLWLWPPQTPLPLLPGASPSPLLDSNILKLKLIASIGCAVSLASAAVVGHRSIICGEHAANGAHVLSAVAGALTARMVQTAVTSTTREVHPQSAAECLQLDQFFPRKLSILYVPTVTAVAVGLIALPVAGFAVLHFNNARLSHSINRASAITDGNSDATMASADYIIVGGGSAGCVLARRLADGGKNVVLFEAGPARSDQKLHIPAAAMGVMGGIYDWGLLTEPEAALIDTSQRMPASGRRLLQCRGRVLGGSSALNLCIWSRASTDFDFTAWPSAWQTLPSLFDKVESMMHINKPSAASLSRGAAAFVRACTERLGLPDLTRVDSAESKVGVQLPHLTVDDNGCRVSADRAYLEDMPLPSRARLRIVTNAHVTKVIFKMNDQLPVATGVEVLLNYGSTTKQPHVCEFKAREEVVLSAGPIHTPYIMMNSGIGPKEHITDVGIRCVLDIPGVGSNLQDYAGTGIVCSQNGPSWEKRAISAQALLQEAVRPNSSALATTSVEATAFLPPQSGCDARPQVQLFYQDCIFPFAPLGSYSDFIAAVERGSNPNAFTIHCCLTAPMSRGVVRLRNLPRSRCTVPIIQQNYLAEKDDVNKLVEAIKTARALADTMRTQYEGSEELLPGLSVQTDADLERYVRESACHFFGCLVGTCKMSDDANDDYAVVDGKCRVKGISGLRIVDASVIPRLLCGQPNACVLALAERAAELILQET